MRGIREAVPAECLVALTPREASEDEIAMCHTRDCIEIVKLDVADDVRCLRTGDTELTCLMMELARQYAEGCLVSVLEGGYNLDALASAAGAHVGELAKQTS